MAFRLLALSQASLTLLTAASQVELQTSFEEALNHDTSIKVSLAIEESLWPTFQSLPKNSYGRLEVADAGYAIQRYFVRERHLRISGLLHESLGRSSANDADLWIEQALVNADNKGRGFSMNDVSKVVVVLQQKMDEEPKRMLKYAFAFNNVSSSASLCAEELGSVLTTYLSALYIAPGAKDDILLALGHQHRHGRNPFMAQCYSFEEVLYALEHFAVNTEKTARLTCATQQGLLLGSRTQNQGRVHTSALVKHAGNHAFDDVVESLTYLDAAGAIEDGNLIVANYMVLPSMCSAFATYHSVCCVSECDDIMKRLETAVQAPTVSTGQLTHLIARLASQPLSTQLVERLEKISDDGSVELHGEALAEWLHYAFPTQCPLQKLLKGAEFMRSARSAFWYEAPTSAPKGTTALRDLLDLYEEYYVEPVSQSIEDALAGLWVNIVKRKEDILRVGVFFLIVITMMRNALSHWRASYQAVTGTDGAKDEKVEK